MPSSLKVSFSDRILSLVSYITAGWGGLIAWVILYFAHIKPSKFLKFNIFQSIFISFAYFVIYSILGLSFYIFSHIPIIQVVSSYIQLLFFRPVLFDYSILQIVIISLISYCVLFVILGRYPKIYKVSEWINNMSN